VSLLTEAANKALAERNEEDARQYREDMRLQAVPTRDFFHELFDVWPRDWGLEQCGNMLTDPSGLTLRFLRTPDTGERRFYVKWTCIVCGNGVDSLTRTAADIGDVWLAAQKHECPRPLESTSTPDPIDQALDILRRVLKEYRANRSEGYN